MVKECEGRQDAEMCRSLLRICGALCECMRLFCVCMGLFCVFMGLFCVFMGLFASAWGFLAFVSLSFAYVWVSFKMHGALLHMDGSLLRISRAFSLAYFSGSFAYLWGFLRVGALLRIHGFPSTASTKRARRKTSFFEYAKETCTSQNQWRGKPHKFKYEIQIRKFKYANSNTQIQIRKFKYANSNTQKRHAHLRRARRKTSFFKDAKETCPFQTATPCNSLQHNATSCTQETCTFQNPVFLRTPSP